MLNHSCPRSNHPLWDAQSLFRPAPASDQQTGTEISRLNTIREYLSLTSDDAIDWDVDTRRVAGSVAQ